MSTQIDFARIVLLNRTSREFLAANPVLLAGEAAVADVTSKTPSLRFGDGVRPWASLPSFNALGAPGDGGAATLLQAPVLIPPGPDGSITLTVHGAPNNVAQQVIGGQGNTAFEVMGADQVAPGWYYATIHPLVGTTPRPGTSNGLNLAAGTNADDTALLVQNAAGTKTFERIRGDGSGYLGPDVSNSMYWDATGKFAVRGTATFPAPSMAQISDVSFTNLQPGHVLEWNGTNWTNVLQTDGTVRQIGLGTGLTSPDSPGMITVQGTIALADTAVTPGDYTFADLTVDAQGRLTHAASGVILTNPQEGQAITFDGTHWVNSTPANALATLTDVELDAPLPDDVLAFDGSHWGNTRTLHLTHLTIANDPVTERDAATKEYVDGAIAAIPPPPPPEEGITQLVQLTDVSVSGVQDGQVIAWDTAASRWRNRDAGGALATLSDVTVTTPTVGQLLTYNGTRWVNGGSAVVTGGTGLDALTVRVAGSNAPGLFVNATESTGTTRIKFSGSSNFNGAICVGNTDVMTFSNARNVTINGPSSGPTLTVVASGSVWEALQLNSYAANMGIMMRATDSASRTASFGMNSNAQGAIRTANADRITIEQTGAVTINEAAGGSFTVYGTSYFTNTTGGNAILTAGPVQLYDLNWNTTAYFGGDGSGYLNRNTFAWTTQPWFFCRAPLTVQWGYQGNTAFEVFNGAGNTLFMRVASNASGGGSTVIQDDLTVNYGGSPMIRTNGAGGVSNPLRVDGLANQTTFVASNAWNTSGGAYAGLFIDGSSNTNCSNGLMIRAGTNTGDFIMRLQQSSSVDVLRLAGNGSWDIMLPSAGPGTPQFNVYNGTTNLLIACVGTTYNQVRFPNAQTTTAPANCYLEGGNFNQICRFTSSIRYKHGVRTVGRSLARQLIARLRTVSFYSKCEVDDPNRLNYGLIAEEVAKVDPALVSYDREGKPQGVHGERVAMLMLPLLQELLGLDEPIGETYG